MGLDMSESEAKEVVEIRAQAIQVLNKMKDHLSDVQQSEIDGMIDAIEGMYNPYEYTEKRKWQ